MLHILPMMTDTHPGAKIRTLRTGRGMTLDDLSQRTGLDISTLSRIERGYRNVPEAKRAVMARALGVRIADLVG